VYALVLQSQSYASAETLAREFFRANPGLPKDIQNILERVIFVHVEETIKLMVDNPRLTVRSNEISQQLDSLSQAVTRERRRPEMKDAESQRALASAGRVTRQIITAMTVDDLTRFWSRLRRLLDKILQDSRPS
jgi:hypothetical protein